MDKIKLVEQSYLTKKVFPKFNVGDTIKTMTRIPEGDKVRLHPFEGIVIAKKGTGTKSSFIVRKVSSGEGVELKFFLHSSVIERIEVVKRGKVKRAKLYYLRNKIGKRATKIKSVDVKPE
jgi:large subunit ribosomal protein L19